MVHPITKRKQKRGQEGMQWKKWDGKADIGLNGYVGLSNLNFCTQMAYVSAVCLLRHG